MMLKHLFYLIAKLPNPWAQRLGAGVGRLLFYFGGREKNVAVTNIRLCFPELNDKQQRMLVKATLIENAKTLLEMPKLFTSTGQYAIDLVTEVEGIEYYHHALADGKGLIVLAPHLGNWEITVHYLNQFAPMTAMFAPPKQAFLNDIMRTARQSTGATLVPADASGVRAQLKQLKQGGVIGILPDQQPKGTTAGVFAPFMGVDAYTMLLVNNLAKRTGARVIMTFAERLAVGQGYKLHILPAPIGIAADDELEAATQLNEGVEQCVRLAPAQYQWTYKRFNRQPEGKVSPYAIKDKTKPHSN